MRGWPVRGLATMTRRWYPPREFNERVRLYITRHAKAQPESESGRDEDRPLRKRGERQARWLAEHFAGDGALPPALILTSGRTRAQETARVLHDRLACDLCVEPTLDLGHSVSDVLDAIEEAVRAGCAGPIMLIGHNPQLESLIGVLLEGTTGAPVRLRTGECAVIEIGEGAVPGGEGGGTLVAMIRLDD